MDRYIIDPAILASRDFLIICLPDTSDPLVGPRLQDFIQSSRLSEDREPPSSPPVPEANDELLDRLHYFKTPTLAHLLALLFHPSPSFPPAGTRLIIIDAVSTLFATAFSRTIETSDARQGSAKKNETAQWAANRRWAVMGDFVSRIGKLAATRAMAIVLVSQTTIKVRAGHEAVLRPALSSKAWDEGIHNRIALFRDWPPLRNRLTPTAQFEIIRFAGVEKAGGVSCDGFDQAVPFRIDKVSLECCDGVCGSLLTDLAWCLRDGRYSCQ